ncbi:hypothetical protein Caci_7796 [Catenulispora acidiphila DSM 44928]|uniref:Uncharacterized protein n=1 Tax=Catenulispora acidiphila (strain DSM 44928 / JCM 14897 / NBRC 102108 / NRRL B-24433 / ID139908) TaxID=479433 RepID=C7QE32_CATAD|nr:hypothetical protein [Catenulispora acidiphila]ACU76620.1 hypothetical protein Caci_7796 [Catenulispora acidiphila DSM 44928]
MRIMTGTAVDNRVAMTPAPVYRALEAFAADCRRVSGQECFGSAAAAWQVESVSGTGLAGAAGFLGLVALGEGLLERHGYVGQLGQERPRPVFQLVPAPGTGRILADEQAPIDGSGTSERDDDSNDSSKGDNGSKPMTPWDFRTSGPPG